MSRLLLHALAILVAVLYLYGLNAASAGRRHLPPAGGDIPFFRVGTQQDVYGVLRAQRVLGAHIVHLNRHFNMVEYLPEQDRFSRPFPLPAYDMRPFYEMAVDSHNWLYIASRTGIARRITSVLPERVFQERLTAFSEDPAFRVQGGRVLGYSRDVPRVVATLRMPEPVEEPVAVVVDAGFFDGSAAVRDIVSLLRRACPDIRLLVLVESRDEPDVTTGMLKELDEFVSVWNRWA